VLTDLRPNATAFVTACAHTTQTVCPWLQASQGDRQVAENGSVGPIKEIPIDGKTSVSLPGQLIAVMKAHKPSPKT